MSGSALADAPKKRALVILAEGAEEAETVCTVDVLRRGKIEVVLAGLDGEGPVTCSRGVRLLPDTALHHVLAQGQTFDAIVLPGER
jgi:protein DJ-1